MGALSDRANIYFAVGAKPSASVLVIFDYDKDKKTRRSFKVYKNASVLNDKLKELEVMYYNGKSEETIWDAIDQAVQRKELLSFNSESHYFSFDGSSGRRSYSVSEGSIEGHREGAGRNRVHNSGLVSRRSRYRAVTDGDYLAAVDPNQIKSADPVTYDDKGDVIPPFRNVSTRKKTAFASPFQMILSVNKHKCLQTARSHLESSKTEITKRNQ